MRLDLARLRLATRLALAVLGAYLVVVVAACTFQRSLLYFPDPHATAPDPAGPPMQVVNLKTRDGETLIAWFLPPKAGEPVILHFGGNGDSLIGQENRWRQIADAGVGVLGVAYRGYSGSTGHPSEAGLHMDAEAAYVWLAARYPAGDIVIMGHSLGTGVATALAAEHPARALILESPFTSAVDVGAERMPWLPVRLMMWDRFDSTTWIGKVRAPVLIVHGDRDEVIDYRFGRALFAQAREPKTFVRIAGGMHNDLAEHGLYPAVWRFLGLRPPAPT
jgi:fermentation-respiration switch protein FrsA (DUF1100 family)